MKEIKKRTEGKIKGGLGIREMYKYFKTYSKTKISYKDYVKIIKTCNKEILDVIVNEAKVFEMPYRLGALQVSKFERSFNKSTNRWAVDFKKSKELGYKVFFEQPFIYKWVWRKRRAIFINKTGYKFTASRLAKRLVPKALSTKKIDYYSVK